MPYLNSCTVASPHVYIFLLLKSKYVRRTENSDNTMQGIFKRGYVLRMLLYLQ